MWIRPVTIVLLALPLAGLPAKADTPATAATNREAGFMLVQMSDPQLGMFTENRSFDQETALFEQAIARANRLRPAFVVITGDLVHKTGDKAQEDEVLRIAATLDKSIALYYAAGNHDVGKTPTPESLAHYRRRFGRDWYSFDHAGSHFVVVNSCLMQDPRKAPQDAEQQMAWLRKDLADAAAARYHHVVVFQHHPLFVKDPAEKDDYHNIPLKTRQSLLALYKEAGVKLVLAGHLHGNVSARDGDLEVLAIAPVGKPLRQPTSGFYTLTVHPGRIEKTFVPLPGPPKATTRPVATK